MTTVRTQTQACTCTIQVPVDVRVKGRLAINHYLRMLLCGFRPWYEPMLCPYCRTPFRLRMVKE